MEINPSVLRRVQMDNIRNNQIGGETDGVTPEVAVDLGFMATEEVVELIDELPKPNSKPLTSAQKNENARRHVAEHLKRTNKQVIDPNYG